MEAGEASAYWMEMAEYDFETARAMLKAKRFLYVGFMAHQAVEKALKAYHWKAAGNEPPYTHDLWKIVKSGSLVVDSDGPVADLFDELQPLNVEARYPKDKEALMSSLNCHYCESLPTRTEACLEWIKAKL